MIWDSVRILRLRTLSTATAAAMEDGPAPPDAAPLGTALHDAAPPNTAASGSAPPSSHCSRVPLLLYSFYLLV
jgi:hypothetical protein